jgi:hypothetical protein|tara:strand:+ start:82 stop:966 length:885 start_codon:yes stop_codon:yes gene_type:complete
MAVIIGSGKDAYRYNPENPRDVSDRVNSFEDRGRLPNIPDNLITNEMRLENLVDNKDYFKNQPSPTRPGMNVYQDRMQDFRTSSPEAMQTYADRFPLTQFMMTAPEKIARSTMLGNVISSIGGGFNKAKNFAGGLFPGDNTMLNNMAGDFAALPSKFKKDAGTMAKEVPQILLQDMDKGVSAFRDFFGVKKNNATDIAETALGDFEVPTADPMINQTGVTSDDYNQMYDFPLANFLKGTGLPEQERVLSGEDVAAKIPDRTLQTSQFTQADIANALAYPGTRQAETLRQLGIIK